MGYQPLQSDFVKAGFANDQGPARVVVFRKTLYRADFAHNRGDTLFGVLDPVPLAALPASELSFSDFVQSVQRIVAGDHSNASPSFVHGVPRYNQYFVDVHGDTGAGPIEEDIWPMVAEVELKNGMADTSPVAIYNLRQEIIRNLQDGVVGAMGESFEDVYGVFFKDVQGSRGPMELQPPASAYRQQIELF